MIRVYNHNEQIRKSIINKYNADLEEDTLTYLEDLCILRENNCNAYKSILEALYPVFYIMNYMDLIFYNHYPNEGEETRSVTYDEKELSVIDSIDDLIAFCENDPNILNSILIYNHVFYSFPKLHRKMIFSRYNNLDKLLCQVSSTYFIDKIEASMISKDELLQEYDEYFENHCNDKDDKHLASLQYLNNYLCSLCYVNNELFLDLISELCLDYYKYITYVIDFKLYKTNEPFPRKTDRNYKIITESDIENIAFICTDSNEFMLNIIDRAIEFRKKDGEFQESAEAYYQKNKPKLKFLKKVDPKN